MERTYIFGYGSLVSAASIASTIKREPAILLPTILSGWVRNWEITLQNSGKALRYKPLDPSEALLFVASLNVRLPLLSESPTNPNGVLFDVTEQELLALDKREAYYQRQEISQYIKDPPAGRIYTYVGTPEHCRLPSHATQVIVPKSYLELVEEGFAAFGGEFLEDFHKTTQPPDMPISPTVYINPEADSELPDGLITTII